MDKSNSSHRPLPYYEWWYLHFITETGIAMNMVVHETDIFGMRQKPYISLSVYLPDREPQYLRRDFNNSVIERGNPYLNVGNGMISENAQTIWFNIPFEERCYFRGEITKLSPPLILDDGILFHEADTGRTSNWVVQVPHATFTGILELDGKVQHVEGMAYQDHQWGTLLIQEFASDWVWGHFSNSETAFVFFHILTQNGQLIERVALLTSEGHYVGTTVATTHLNTLFQDEQPEMFAETVNVSFFTQQLQVAFDVSQNRIMRSRIGEVLDHKLATYLRWSTEASLQFGSGQKSGCYAKALHGISEYIRIRPAMYGKLSNQ